MTGLYQQPTQMNSGMVIHLSFHSFNTFIQVDLHSSDLFGIFFFFKLNLSSLLCSKWVGYSSPTIKSLLFVC